MTGSGRNAMIRMVRYGWAAAGPLSVAVCQFVLSLQLLRLLPQNAFGTFAFLMVTSQFSAGVWSALFCAPLPVLFAEDDHAARQATVRCLFATSLVGAILAAIVFTLLGVTLDVPILASAFFAAYAAVSLLRWYARAYAYTTGSPLKATVSDLVFSTSLLLGILWLARAASSGLETIYAVMAGSVVLGLGTFGVTFLAQLFRWPSLRDLLRYAEIWRRHSGWSLVGVVSIEATANAHAYIVTLAVGPSAFAPVAASALLIRPIAVVMNALTDYERRQIAQHIGQGEFQTVGHALRLFRYVLFAIWGASAIGGGGLLLFEPRLIFPARYEVNYLALGAVLWMIVACIRLLRTPESVLLQGAGAFRWLAYASLMSSGLSVVSVTVFLFTSGPMWSVAGVLIGESVFAWITLRRARGWLTSRLSATPPTPSSRSRDHALPAGPG